MIFGMVFNISNTYLQARWINTFSNDYSLNWLLTPYFYFGISIFIIGFVINIHSDYIIRNLRDPGEDGYKIPRGGLFQWISSPNYLGEIIEWNGWAIMTWSLPGLIFAIWTFANLVPRAYANHLWYLKNFSEYPDKRKALIPYIV
jgi:steroid 5-alpha reductase family enzyme